MRRRDFLMGLGGTALTACATSPSVSTNSAASVLPVKVFRDRIIKSVVGLRPHRDGGFRLETAPFMGKTLVHNYGHSGDGVSLSHGSSRVAAEMAHASGTRDTAIIGAGVMGLTTARLLAGWGHDVTIYAADMPPNTTSNIAGALIITPDYYDRRNPTKDVLDQDARVNEVSDAQWDTFVGQAGYGVKRVNHYFLRGEGSGEDIPENRTFLGRRVGGNRTAVLVDPGIYLAALVDDLKSAGVTFQSRRFTTPDQIGNLSQETIVNCTGLGAGQLFLDVDVVPVRGQLTLLKPQPEIDYSYIARSLGFSSLYMFPRDSAIVLGGTRQRGETHMSIDEETVERMMRSHGAIANFASTETAVA